MSDIAIPRLSSNDDGFTLRSWQVADGARVEVDTVVAIVEDSKTTVEVTAGAAGFLRRRAEVGREYEIGHVIAVVTSDADAPAPAAPDGGTAAAAGKVVITKGARDAMAELGVTEDAVNALGKPVVRREDIVALAEKPKAAGAAPAPAAPQPSADAVPLPKHQIAVGRVVSTSHRTIPKAYLLVKMKCDALLKRIEGRSFGPTEAVIRMVADLAERFPNVYARLEGDAIVTPTDEVNVGVTFDLGNGLFIPVVHGAQDLMPDEIGARLKAFREHATAGKFPDHELVGGHVTVALNPGEGIVFSLPIIPPGQTAILALGSISPEVVPLEEGGFGVSQYIHIGLAYDHRVVNGSYALDYFAALRRKIEFPGSNRWL